MRHLYIGPVVGLSWFAGCDDTERSLPSNPGGRSINFVSNRTANGLNGTGNTEAPTTTTISTNSTTTFSHTTEDPKSIKTTSLSTVSPAPTIATTVSPSASSSSSTTAEPSSSTTVEPSSSTTAAPRSFAPSLPPSLPIRPAPASQPDTSLRFIVNGNFYERPFVDGEGDIDAVVLPNAGPADPDTVPTNRVGEWVTGVGSHTESVARRLAAFMSNDFDRDVAEGDYMEFWAASRGRILIRDAAARCGTRPTSSTGLNCYNLMMLATNIPVPPDRKPRHVARDIGLERFCIDNEAALVRELHYRRVDLPNRLANGNAPLLDRYVESYTTGFAANWFSFCPNLAAAASREIREMVFNHGVYRAKIFAASPRDSMNQLRVNRDTLFSDAIGGFLAASNVGNLLRPVTRVEFLGSLEIGSGQGVVTNWYNEMSAQIFGNSTGLFEYVNSNRYVRLKAGILELARNDGTEAVAKAKLRAAGRFFGHVIAAGRRISADLSTMFYARLLGKMIGFEALREYEPQTYGFFEQAHGLDDYTYLPMPGQARVNPDDDWPDAIRDQEYVLDRAASDYVTYNVGEEYNELVGGLFEVIPQSVFESGIKTTEFREILFGALEVDVEDMFRNWVLHGFRETSQEIQWLKEILREFDQANLRRFVNFVTGSSQVPAGGFRMYPLVGVQYPFTITRFGNHNLIPTAANCFNELKFDSFSSKDEMRRLLVVGLDNGAGFGLV